jgi:hypothetical protein
MDLENETVTPVWAAGWRGFAFQLDKPLGGGVRLGGPQPGQVIGERGVAVAGRPSLAPVRGSICR